METGSTRELTLPRWYDWGTAVLAMQRTVAVPGEVIDTEAGVLSWARRTTSGDIGIVTVRPSGKPGSVAVESDGDGDRTERQVRRRLHLELGDAEVTDVVERSAYAPLPADAMPFRIPSAVSPWAFCLTYLSGGSATHDFTRRLFEIGEHRGNLMLPPTPAQFADLTQSEVEDTGVIAPRARALLQVASAFATDPDLDDPEEFGSLPAEEAVRLVRDLPRLGRTRAPHLAALAWGHHDVAYDPYSLLGAGRRSPAQQAEMSDAFQRAAPWRSVLADTICVELIGEGAGDR